MRQRVMIAMALSCQPELLIADEPTTALDVTIQAQILELIKDLKKELGTSVILITHDLGVVAEVAHRVMVMYAGRVVETAPAEAIFKRPFHPYTEGLLASIPRLAGPIERLDAIPGQVPPPEAMPAGCRFAPRCRYVVPACRTAIPPSWRVMEAAFTPAFRMPVAKLRSSGVNHSARALKAAGKLAPSAKPRIARQMAK